MEPIEIRFGGGAEVCDFCHGPEVAWGYPATSFTVQFRFGRGVGRITSHGAWAACDQCKRLIDRGMSLPIIHRCYHTMLEDMPPISRESKRDLLRHAKHIHNTFARHRTTPAPLPHDVVREMERRAEEGGADESPLDPVTRRVI